LQGGGAKIFTEATTNGRASVEKGHSAARAHRGVRHPELSGMSSTALRGCYGTYRRGRKDTEQGLHHVPPNREAGEGSSVLTCGEFHRR
jgi:hypothetical protein